MVVAAVVVVVVVVIVVVVVVVAVIADVVALGLGYHAFPIMQWGQDYESY